MAGVHGVGIGGTDHHVLDTGRDDGAGARAGAPLRAAGLEGDVKRRARPGQALEVVQRHDFRVRFAVPGVETLRHHLALLHDDGAHQGIRVRVTPALPGHRQGAPHEVLVKQILRGVHGV